MRKPTSRELPREALMLAGILVLAIVSPLVFDQPVVNWVSALFVILYIGSRVAKYAADGSPSSRT